MRKMISKATVAAVAAFALCATLLVSAEPASAAFRMGGGGFGGGWHGGGWGGGGWRGGWGGGGWRGGGWGWRGGGWGGGWRTAGWGWRGGGWNGCGWGGCGWGGGWWWPGVATGVALASAYPYWGGDYGYGDTYGSPYDNGCIQLRPVYSRWGRYLGRRWVNVCY